MSTMRYAVCVLSAAVLASACAHEKPFAQDGFGADTTRLAGTERQLTYNQGADLTPAWRLDGSSIMYMFEDLERDDHDRCLAFLPPSGGRITREICGPSDSSPDSIDTFYEPAEGPGGQLLYLRESSNDVSLTPTTAAMVLSRVVDPSRGVPVRPFPYTASDGKIHQGIAFIHWLSSTRALYLAQRVMYIPPFPFAPPDTVRMGIELATIDLAGATPAIQIVSGTDDASSVALGGSADEIYFTKNGDSVVYHMTLSTGAVVPVHDFGSAGIARDVAVEGNRLLAVVGGKITYALDPTLGQVQNDAAGVLWQVDLATGNALPLQAPFDVTGRLFRRPTIAPSGNRAVAVGYDALISDCLPAGCKDTTVSKQADLWLLDLP